DVMSLIEGLLIYLVEKTTNKRIKEQPFPRLSYTHVMDRYGTDHPDLRFGLPLVEISDLASAGHFGVFQSVLAASGMVKGVRVPATCQAGRTPEVDRSPRNGLLLGGRFPSAPLQ